MTRAAATTPSRSGSAAGAPSARGAHSVLIGRRRVAITNPDKVLYPDSGFTKAAVIGYYLRMAGEILPHIKGRPLTLKRYPNGVAAGHFYEKKCPSFKPDWLRTLHVRATTKSTGFIDYCTIDDAAGLIWMANLASLEIHAVLSREPDFDRPTMMVFDFDPGEPANVLDAAKTATDLRDVLTRLGLTSFVKTSGGKGIHLAVPLNTTNVTFDDTAAYSRAIAEILERAHPDRVTSVMAKAKRPGKVFIDWSQNAFHKTTCAVYSLRAKTGYPTVSTPLEWPELERAVKRNDEQALTFLADDVLQRVHAKGDLWSPVLKQKQKLPRFG
jgi:bifunctional non-homologous end joining protein LigD